MMHRKPCRARRGMTVIGMIILLLLVAIVAGIILANVDFQRYRMDADARALKNQFIAQQLTAIKLNIPVIVDIVIRPRDPDHHEGRERQWDRRSPRSIRRPRRSATARGS